MLNEGQEVVRIFVFLFFCNDYIFGIYRVRGFFYYMRYILSFIFLIKEQEWGYFFF